MIKPFFSIIIPVYNVQDYLKQCIDSVLSQTFKDYEIILIDDKSTDNSGDICDFYAGKYSNIVVIHNENNTGLAAARNVGLDNCEGKFVFFIDSDDFLPNNEVLLKIKQQIIEVDCDVLIIGISKYFEKMKTYKEFHPMTNNNNINDFIKSNIYKACAWNKIVKHSLITQNQLRFPFARISEDIIWCFDLLKNTNKISCLNNNCYAYRQRNGSLSKPITEENIKFNIENIMLSLEICLDDTNNNLDNKVLFYSYLAYEYSWLLGIAAPYWTDYKDKLKSLSFLLEYNLCDKVKKVYSLRKILGLRFTSLACYLLIKIKSRMLLF